MRDAGRSRFMPKNRILWRNYSTRDAKTLIIFTIVYLALSFGFSFIGFLYPETPVPLSEYSGMNLFAEVGGHFLFGFAAALPFLDLDLTLLGGVFAVAIDSDHILSSMGFYVSGRPSHSFFFAVFSGEIAITIGEARFQSVRP